MRRDTGDPGCFGVRLDELPYDFLTEAFAYDAIGAIHRSENVTLRYTCGIGPSVDGYFDPGWHRRSADPAVLTNQVDNAPPAIALLHMGESERRHFRTSEPAA